MAGFHEVRFPLDISLRARGGPQRRSDVIVTGAGREERNARWIHARRRYDAGYGVKSLAALATVVAFFEERRGMLYGFRWRDRTDFKSCDTHAEPTPLDQPIGIGDGVSPYFALCKTYGAAFAPYARPIAKPVDGTVRIAVSGIEAISGQDFDCDATTGTVTFRSGHVPGAGARITAGFLFDVPVRFDTDYLEVDLGGVEAGQVPKIPLIEIRP